jgi:hypothetical protein
MGVSDLWQNQTAPGKLTQCPKRTVVDIDQIAISRPAQLHGKTGLVFGPWQTALREIALVSKLRQQVRVRGG